MPKIVQNTTNNIRCDTLHPAITYASLGYSQRKIIKNIERLDPN